MPLMWRAGGLLVVWRTGLVVVVVWWAGRGGACGYPEEAIPPTLARWTRSRRWSRTGHLCTRSCASRAVQQGLGGLPRGVVHGYAWPGNAVQTSPGAVTLIDWETGGLGLPVLDLGNCLIESLLDAEPSGEGPGAWLVEPDADRVAAAAADTRGSDCCARPSRPCCARRYGSLPVTPGPSTCIRRWPRGGPGHGWTSGWKGYGNRVAVSEAVARLRLLVSWRRGKVR